MKRKFVESQFTGKLDLESEEGSNHKIFWVKEGNTKITRTQISRGKEYKELGDIILSLIARQLYLTLSQLKDALNCPMPKEKFYEIVSQKHREKYPR
jgi:hypothetical protein